MRLLLVSAAIVASLTLVTSVQSAGRGRHSPHRVHASPYNKQAAIGAYGRAVYPKYYWGFHSREFQNIGVPHGDIGIRGNDLSMGPW